MKKSLVLVLALMLLLVSVTPSFAAGGPPVGRGSNGAFTLAGTITAIDGTTVTVHVVGGSSSVKAFVGKDLALQTINDTRYLLKTSTATVPITFADLQVGQNISASGTVANDVWTALRITVGAELIHYP
jgi:hypothetical protein